MLDNSIYAAGNSAEKLVDINVIINRDYFSILCRNSFSERKNSIIRTGDHGHGISIIKAIAKKYSGNYSDKKENSYYYSEVKLENKSHKKDKVSAISDEYELKERCTTVQYN